MKHNSFFALGLIGLMTLAISGCNGFEEQKPNPSEKGTFVIMVAPETKTQMVENQVVWSDGDKLTVFAALNGDNVEFTRDYDNRFTGDLVLPADTNDWYVLYPYNSEIKTPANTSTGAINIGCAPGGYQTQVGNKNSAHLVGPHFPLYGKVAKVPSNVMPEVTLKQALSILRVRVTNKTTEPLTVNEVSFTGTEGIAGSFYINFADSAFFTPASASNTATLKVTDGAPISVNDSADFYLAIKPFKATSGKTLTLAVNGYKKSIDLSSDVSFKEGKIRTLKFDTPTEFPPLIEAWEETALSAIAPDDVLVIVGTNSNGSYAMTNNNGTSAAPAAVSVETGSVTKSGSTLIGAIADTLQWNVSGNATDGYTFYPNGSTNTWLYCISDNNGVRVGKNDNKTFTITDGYLQHMGTSRYVGIYNNADWRCYTTINDNIKDQTFAFYRQTSEYAKAYAITIDHDITGGTIETDPASRQYEGSPVSLKAYPSTGNLFTSWSVYKTGAPTTVIPVEKDQFVMPGYPVTVAATFGAASLTVSQGTTPAEAECEAGSEVTFTVISNVPWTAAATTNAGYVQGLYVGQAQIDGQEPGVINASADPVTVTVKMNANSGEERTATISVTPVDQTSYSSLNQDITVTQKLYTAPAIRDTITYAKTGLSGTGYANWTIASSKTISGASYAGQSCCNTSNYLQFRSSNNNSGIITTGSTGTVKALTVKWNNNTGNANKVLNVYACDTTLTAISSLYSGGLSPVATLTYNANKLDTTYIFTQDYEFFGVRSSSGALYLDEVIVEWNQVTKYAITIDGNIENGTVTASAASIAAGETVTLTVTPDAGYQLNELTVYKTGDSSTKVTVTNNTFTMPEYAVTVTASFSAVPSINVLKSSFNAPAAAGTYIETGVYELLNGALDDVVEAIGDDDVVTVVGWEDGDITYTVTANTGAAREGTILISYNNGDPEEITVNQAAAQYQLTLTAPGDGYSITAKVGNTTVATATTTDQSVNLNYGSEVTLSATAPDGYTLDAWTVNGNVIEGEQFTLNGATTVTATFKAGIPDPGTENNPYSASAAYAAASGTEVENVYVKGIVSAITTVYSSKYNNVSFTISDDGLTSSTQFTAFRTAATSEDDVLVGDCVILKGTLKLYNSTTPELLAGNTIEARLSMPTFTSGDENFVTSTSVALTVAEGATIHYTTDGTTPTIESAVYASAINLSSTTTINAIAEKDGLVTGVASKTFTKLQSYALTWSTPSNGTLVVKQGETTITSGTMVPENATINITATPADGYTLSTLVYNDGSDHDIKSTKSFTMPAHAVSVTATFEQSGGTQDHFTTITYENFTNTSYNTSESTFIQDEITFGYVNAMRNGSNGTPNGWAKNQVIQTKNTGSIYNKTSMGNISKIRVYIVANTNSFTITSGSSAEPTTNSVTRPSTATGTESITYSSYANKKVTEGQTTTAYYYDFTINNQPYFKIAPGGSLYIYKIEITYSN